MQYLKMYVAAGKKKNEAQFTRFLRSQRKFLELPWKMIQIS